MERTTVALDDDLLRTLQERAVREERTLQEVANELLRYALYQQERLGKMKFQLRGWEATEQPGVDLLDRDKLFEWIADSPFPER